MDRVFDAEKTTSSFGYHVAVAAAAGGALAGFVECSLPWTRLFDPAVAWRFGGRRALEACGVVIQTIDR
jgi:hypothetical protein